MRAFILAFVFSVGLSLNASAAVVKAGEKIHYNVNQMGVKIGEAHLTFGGEQTYENQKAILITFLAQGFNFYDEEKIYVTADTYKPIAVLRDLNIFGNKEKIEEHYTKDHVRVVKKVGDKTTEQTIDKAGAMDNIYAFIYQYRQSGSFKMDDRLDVHLPTKDITIKLVKQVSLSTAGQKYNAYYMESDPAKYKLWFDASERKLPLRISGAIGVANTVMAMTGYDN